MGQWAFVQDRFVPEAEAVLPAGDLAIQRRYGIFDFFRTTGGQPLYVDDHLNRFYRSADRMHLAVPYGQEELKGILWELMQRNNLPESGIRMTLTGGLSPDGYRLSQPGLLITEQPLSAEAIRKACPGGLRLITCEHQRQLPDVKTIDYLMGIWLQPYIAAANADDVLYHRNGEVTECPRSNFFIVTQNDELLTPAAGILEGITRKQVLSLAARHLPVREGTLTLEMIRQAKEAFITSTTRLVTPVASVDAHTFTPSCSLAAVLRKELESHHPGPRSSLSP